MEKSFAPIAIAFIGITTLFSTLAYPTHALKTTQKNHSIYYITGQPILP
ncbi:hypothetical protein LTSEADE_5255 [Salmonella enterica subsp. enterica serovar Adelaide str. A4-669]|uniref:Uncharacterized protein n=2 Tax=Salmonella enterica I TaxID=59201 RepID=A0A6C8GGA3_SALET|nr:hypothetical protein LTSEADE_5255 [Salmonella enterica subsp. enterica serovar Adelaide str. A4-669]EHC86207.1 hypothetical protein LTSEUGA_5181 [Salmonella enterica subsp. enterica serovar Uganda str. R8-3404]EIW8127679.1 hypothetical protein [Salmonella enterica]EIW8128171.1 hypothetical protein [Salmonella enterica]SUF03357.1 Uncharacterised protein [Salmonella enterica]